MALPAWNIRPADRVDVDAMADAHRDSIQSAGKSYYPVDVVEGWQDGISGGLYLEAMDRGEVFLIATKHLDGKTVVLGFSSDYPIEGTTHGTSVYVRGKAVRQGLGTALLQAAERHAVAAGATDVRIDASLAGTAFYRANGYVEVGRGEITLLSGQPIRCVFMRKSLMRARR